MCCCCLSGSLDFHDHSGQTRPFKQLRKHDGTVVLTQLNFLSQSIVWQGVNSPMSVYAAVGLLPEGYVHCSEPRPAVFLTSLRWDRHVVLCWLVECTMPPSSQAFDGTAMWYCADWWNARCRLPHKLSMRPPCGTLLTSRMHNDLSLTQATKWL